MYYAVCGDTVTVKSASFVLRGIMQFEPKIIVNIIELCR